MPAPSPSAQNEEHLNAVLQRAGELLRGEQVDAADREVTEALRLSPNDVRARNLLGLVRFRAGRYEDAFSVYRELVQRDPDDTALRLNLGLVELRLGRHFEAAQDLRKVLDLEPQNQKAQGYLGLALMRSGDLAGARTAFHAGGQSDLVRQVEEQIAAGAAAGSIVTRMPVPPRSGPVRGLEGELPIDPGAHKKRPDVSAARLPVPLSTFVESRELRPGGVGEPFSIEGGLLVVRVDGRVPMRTAGALASSGRLSYAPILRRTRGRQADETFGEGEEALVAASGHGTIVLSPRGQKFSALVMADKDVLYVRESMVVAFEESLYFENGRIPGSGAADVVQIRGNGRVVLRSRRVPRTVKITGGDVLYVDQDALLGWTGEVVPTQLRGVDGMATQFVSVSGEGAILVDEPPSPPATVESAAGAVQPAVEAAAGAEDADATLDVEAGADE